MGFATDLRLKIDQFPDELAWEAKRVLFLKNGWPCRRPQDLIDTLPGSSEELEDGILTYRNSCQVWK